ncbi:FkbM family methyltransferase [Prochlorococcus marinus]|nr:FkbM family methyltransferase [Prochlorococcus marinus]
MLPANIVRMRIRKMPFNFYKASKIFVENKKNPIFLDLGANMGLFTFFISRLGFECHSFEPHPYYFSILEKRKKLISIEKNLKPNIKIPTINKLGVSNFHGKAELFFSNKIGSHSFSKSLCIDDSGTSTISKITTLDNYCKGIFNHNSNIFIKIDIEGDEVKSLEGAKELIKDFSPDIFIEVRRGKFNTLDITKDFLESCGYNIFMSKNSFTKQNQIHDDIYCTKDEKIDLERIDKDYKLFSRKQKICRLLNNIVHFRIADIEQKVMRMPWGPDYKSDLKTINKKT